MAQVVFTALYGNDVWDEEDTPETASGSVFLNFCFFLLAGPPCAVVHQSSIVLHFVQRALDSNFLMKMIWSSFSNDRNTPI